MSNTCRVIVAYHKPDVYPSNDVYIPIHVGKALSKQDMGIQADNEGLNISEKNPYYCELTAIYWAWKNLKDVDVIGLCHYRRYFDFHKQCRPFFPMTTFSIAEFPTLNLSIDNCVLQQVKAGKVVVAKSEMMEQTLKQNYCEWHVGDDFRILESLIMQTQKSDIQTAFRDVFEHGNKLHPYNMFLMRWEDFDAYCSWIFPLLEEIEKKIDISAYSTFQKRIYGFMAERLFNVWLVAMHKVKIEKPIIFVNDEDTLNRRPLGPRKLLRYLRRILYCRMANCYYQRALKLWK